MADTSDKESLSPDDVVNYLGSLIQQGKAAATSGVQQAQKAIWDALGVGQADAMSPQAQLRYKEATDPTAFEPPAPAPWEGQVNLKSQPTPDQIAKALIMQEQTRKTVMKPQSQGASK